MIVQLAPVSLTAAAVKGGLFFRLLLSPAYPTENQEEKKKKKRKKIIPSSLFLLLLLLAAVPPYAHAAHGTYGARCAQMSPLLMCERRRLFYIHTPTHTHTGTQSLCAAAAASRRYTLTIQHNSPHLRSSLSSFLLHYTRTYFRIDAFPPFSIVICIVKSFFFFFFFSFYSNCEMTKP